MEFTGREFSILVGVTGPEQSLIESEMLLFQLSSFDKVVLIGVQALEKLLCFELFLGIRPRAANKPESQDHTEKVD